MRGYNRYGPLCSLLSKAASKKLRKGNYERSFDEAWRKVRAWESANAR